MKKIVISVILALITTILVVVVKANREYDENIRKYADYEAATFEGEINGYDVPNWDEIPDNLRANKTIKKNKNLLEVSVKIDNSYGSFKYPIKPAENGKIDVGIEYGYHDKDLCGMFIFILICSLMSFFVVLCGLEALIGFLIKKLRKKK